MKAYRKVRILALLPLFFLLTASAACLNPMAEPPPNRAVQGVLDLREWRFERDGGVRLDGEWAFAWEEQLKPAEAFARDAFASSRFVRVPGTWNGIEVDGRALSGDGFATYRLKVLLPPNREARLGLKFLSLSSAYAFFVNGRKVASCGFPGTTAAQTRPRYRPQVVPLETDTDTLAVTCVVSNYNHWEGGFWKPVTLGPYERLREAREGALRLDVFLLGGILLIGLYHLLLFAVRRQERTTLYFGGFCLLLAVRSVFTGEGYAVLLFPDLTWNAVQRIVYLSFYLAVPLFALYARELFPGEIAKRPVDVLKWAALVLALGVLIVSPRLFTYSMPPFQLATFLAFVYGGFAVTRAVIRGRPGAGVFVAGFAVFFAAAVNDILYSRQIIQTAYVAPLGFLAFIISQAGLLSLRFAGALSTVEQQRGELRSSNLALEAEVENRRQAEDALRVERDRLETITRSIGAGLAVISKDYKTLWMNRVLRDMFGNAEGESCFASFNRRSGICPGCGVREVFEEGRELVVHEQVGEDAGGRTVWSEIIATPIRDGEGRVQAALELVVPITERKALEEQLRHAQKMDAVGTLAGGIAHQFNNALNVISLNLGLIEMEDPDPHEQQLAVDTMKRSVERMSRLTAQLLAYARGGKYKTITVPMKRLMQETLPLLGHHLRPSVRVETDIPEEVHSVEVDPTQFQMVLSALLANASEAIEGEGGIRITGRNEDSGGEGFPEGTGPVVLLTVEDDGKGMDAETVERVFDPFFTTKFKGRGLSMAAVYGIVETHGGRIEVSSEPGVGTKVSIRLPAVGAVQEAPKPEEGDVLPAEEGSGVILVIEDDDMVIDVTRRILEKRGYRVIEARSGEEAMERVQSGEEPISLALLDVMLPDMSGVDLYALLKEARPGLKVIVCSAYGMEGPVEEILGAGAERFLQKPFSSEDLSRAVRDVLEQEA